MSILNEETKKKRDDIKLPAGVLGEQIMAKFKADESVLVTVLNAMAQEAIIAFKIKKKK